MTVQLNPKGSRQHDHELLAKVNNCHRDTIEHLLGVAHGPGEEHKMTAEWFLMTDNGSATINDYWAYNDGEYAIYAANQAAALEVVEYFREHGIQAFVLYGSMDQ